MDRVRVLVSRLQHKMKSLLITTASLCLTSAVIFNVSIKSIRNLGSRMCSNGINLGILAKETVLSIRCVLNKIKCLACSSLHPSFRKYGTIDTFIRSHCINPGVGYTGWEAGKESVLRNSEND